MWPPGDGEPPEDGESEGLEPDEDTSELGGKVIRLHSFGGGHSPVEEQEESDDGTLPPGDAADDDGALSSPPEHLMDAAVEVLLFAADGPVTTRQLIAWLGDPTPALVREALYGLELHYRRMGGGIQLVRVAKGWQLRTDPRLAPWVARMRGGKPLRLSKAALEILSIVAYRQPVTRSEVEDLRGVDSGGVLRMLCERELCTVLGRKDEPGRPLLYGTTPTFLSLFNLRDLSDLPTLRDMRELELDDPRGAPGAAQLELPLEEEQEILDELERLDGEYEGGDLPDEDDDFEPSHGPASPPSLRLPPDPEEPG